MAAEWALFTKSTFASGVESTIAKDSTPLGVTSSFQYWDPYPISVV
jgi:glutamate-1-semialdehyde 2,1-aminomutase